MTPLPEHDDDLRDLVDHPDPLGAMRRGYFAAARGIPQPTIFQPGVKARRNTLTQSVGAVYGPAEEAADLAVLDRVERLLCEPLLDLAGHGRAYLDCIETGAGVWEMPPVGNVT